jgi:hypothetical protein
MAGGNYGYGIESMLPILLSMINGDTTKEQSASATMIQKVLSLLSQGTNLASDADWAVMTGTYAHPPQEEFVPVNPYTKAFLANSRYPLLQKVAGDLFRGATDIPTAAAVLAENNDLKSLAQSNGALPGEEGKYWAEQLKPVLAEAGDNAERLAKWNSDRIDNDPFLKRGLPSVYETYGLEADPSRNVQELPYDKARLAPLEEIVRLASARGDQMRKSNGLQGSTDPITPQGSDKKKPDLETAYKAEMAKSESARAQASPVAMSLDGPVFPLTPGPYDEQLKLARNRINQYKQSQLDAAMAQGRTPLRDNLMERYGAILRAMLQSGG